MATTWQVSSSEVGHLVTRIFDASRTEPLVVVSPTSQTLRPRIDVARLVELLPAGAEVAVLASMEASNLLSDAVDPQFQCYGGSVRVILPGASRTDNWRRHRRFTIYPEDDADQVCALIAGHVADIQGIGPASHSVGRQATVFLDPSQAAQLLAYRRQLMSGRDGLHGAAGDGPGSDTARPAAVDAAGPGAANREPVGPGPIRPAPKPGPGLRRVVTAPPPAARSTPAAQAPAAPPTQRPQPAGAPAEPVPTAPPRTITLDVETLQELLDKSVESVVDKVIASVEDGLLTLLNQEFQAQDQERSRADMLEEQNADLQQRLDAAGPHGSALVEVWADPERQLRWEIEQEWLQGTPEAERGSGLMTYTLTRRFLDSLGADIVPRGKTVRVMVDILAGQAWDRHVTHPFNDAARGGKQRVRHDGATAWRTYVKAESPGAPRLTWWMCADGSVEFEHVGHHDELI
ncbi:hypothetical protein [Acidipropionibacterium thoenii]|uniref:hypothetical protein n=1 Tax=Acidipropionibacterium thoenii TaxID=1751 RepID=UPI0003FA0EA9|nr:hypothetical protein [Acidipropionibacterium thoenii]